MVPEHYYLQLPVPASLPVISIVTPSFNQGRFLERTLRSVLEQDYPRLEFIVQDGGSTDETAAILDRYRSALTSVESRADRGQAHAINLGFQRATGEILAYLNSDDLMLPGALRYVARFFHTHPEIDVVYGHRVVIDEQDAEIGRWVLPPHTETVFYWNDYVPQETLFWRRRIWARLGAGLDEDLHFALDWDLLLRLHRAGARFARLPRFLGAFRIHAEQKTTAHHADLCLPEAQQLRQRFHGRSVSRLEVLLRVSPYLCRSIFYHRLYQLGIVRY
jgi:glycosyltransferase involved in cell wall biosynthesis